MKVLTVVGTRPEIIRLSRVMAALDEYVDHKVVHTGQNYDYELSQIFFDDLALRKPDYFLNAAGKSPVATVAAIIEKIDDALEIEKPDATLILGDSNSCLSAYAAKRRKIPIFHLDAGNRAFDQRVPEEINRRLVDHLADVNLPCSSVARDNLLREGFPVDRVIKIGSPMFEVFQYYRDKIAASDALRRLGVKRFDYYVVSAHREENVDDAEQLARLIETLNNLAETRKRKIIFSAHPRTRKRIEAAGAELHPLIRLLKPLGFHDYNALQQNSAAVLSDSGSIDEESAILNFPALNLRETRERCETNDAGGALTTGVEWSRVSDALKIIERRKRGEEPPAQIGADYRVPNVSEKVARVVFGYAAYVDKFVWRKSR